MIPNQNLFRLANERTGWKEAFKMADQVLYMGVRGVTDLMMSPGLVNLDFADIRTVMAEMGKAMMGTGEAEGENRAIRAAEAAISNPLLEDTSMAGARGLLINITGGDDMTLFEVDQAANRIREEVADDANIIFGSAIDETLSGRVRVSVGGDGHRPREPGRGAAAPLGCGWQRRRASAGKWPRCRTPCRSNRAHPVRDVVLECHARAVAHAACGAGRTDAAAARAGACPRPRLRAPGAHAAAGQREPEHCLLRTGAARRRTGAGGQSGAFTRPLVVRHHDPRHSRPRRRPHGR